MERCLFGGRNTVKVEVQKHRKIVLGGSIKEVTRTLHILGRIFKGRTLGSITDEELTKAMKLVAGIKSCNAQSLETWRRLCGN